MKEQDFTFFDMIKDLSEEELAEVKKQLQKEIKELHQAMWADLTLKPEKTNDEKLAAQRHYCKVNELPYFAPDYGICWYCGENIYKYISFEKASSELITGCPYCFRTYCD